MIKAFILRKLWAYGYIPLKRFDFEAIKMDMDLLRTQREDSKKEIESLKQGRKDSQREIESLRQGLQDIRKEKETLQLEIREADRKLDCVVHEKYGELLKTPDEAARFVNTIVQGVLRKHHRTVFWGDRLLTLDKAAGFFEDVKFFDAYQKIKDSHPYDQYSGPDGIAWRLNTLVWAAKCALRLPGDFVECGVFKGDMAWVIANVVDISNSERGYYLYDTFEGFSPRYSSEDDFPLNPNFYSYANNVYKIPDLYEQVRDRFKEFHNVRVIKGVLPDILHEVAPESISLLHIDINSPAAEIGVLDILFDRVVSGGIIVFDDYGWMEYLRQRRAEDRFMKDRQYDILELPTGQGLVIRR